MAIIYAQNSRFAGFPRGTVPKREEDTSGTDMYQHAKFHADRWHLCQDICPWTHRYNHSRFNIPQIAY